MLPGAFGFPGPKASAAGQNSYCFASGATVLAWGATVSELLVLALGATVVVALGATVVALGATVVAEPAVLTLGATLAFGATPP